MISVLGNLVRETCLELDAPSGTEQRRVKRFRERWGGSALNVAAALGLQGVPATLVAGAVPEAGAIGPLLARLGVALRLTPRARGHQAWIVHEDGRRRMFFQEGAPPPFEQALFPEASLLATSGFDLLADPEGFAALLAGAFERDVPVALDVGPAAARPELVLPVLPKVRYLFLNLEEGRRLTGLRRPCEILKHLQAPEVHLKLGAQGAAARIEGKLLRSAPPPVKEADPVGAGDAYLAGLVGHLEAPPQMRLQQACAWGAWASATEGAGDEWLAPGRSLLTPSTGAAP